MMEGAGILRKSHPSIFCIGAHPHQGRMGWWLSQLTLGEKVGHTHNNQQP